MSLTNKLTKQELRDYVKSLGFAQYEYDNAMFVVPDNENSYCTEWVVEIKDKWLTYVTDFYVSKDNKGAYYIDTNWDKDRKIPYKELPKSMVLDLLNQIAKEWKKAVNEKKLYEMNGDFK
jgi:hypothetical protein